MGESKTWTRAFYRALTGAAGLYGSTGESAEEAVGRAENIANAAEELLKIRAEGRARIAKLDLEAAIAAVKATKHYVVASPEGALKRVYFERMDGIVVHFNDGSHCDLGDLEEAGFRPDPDAQATPSPAAEAS